MVRDCTARKPSLRKYHGTRDLRMRGIELRKEWQSNIFMRENSMFKGLSVSGRQQGTLSR